MINDRCILGRTLLTGGPVCRVGESITLHRILRIGVGAFAQYLQPYKK